MTITTVGVAGSGTMGAGIGIVAARAGFRTKLFDLNADSLERARQGTEAFLAKSVARGKLSEEQLPQILANWSSTTNLEDLADCDLVIEAVFEDLAVKCELFSRLDSRCAQYHSSRRVTGCATKSRCATAAGHTSKITWMGDGAWQNVAISSPDG